MTDNNIAYSRSGIMNRLFRLLAPGAVSIVRFTELERPDAVAAYSGNARLLNLGPHPVRCAIPQV